MTSLRKLKSGDVDVFKQDYPDGTFVAMIVYNKSMLTQEIGDVVHRYILEFGKENKRFSLYTDATKVLVGNPAIFKKYSDIIKDKDSRPGIKRPDRVAIVVSDIIKPFVQGILSSDISGKTPIELFTDKTEAWKYATSIVR